MISFAAVDFINEFMQLRKYIDCKFTHIDILEYFKIIKHDVLIFMYHSPVIFMNCVKKNSLFL